MSPQGGQPVLLDHPIQRGDPQDRALPSFEQERLVFIQQFDPASCHYNLPCARRLKGALDRHTVERTLNVIIQRHDALRTTFRS